MSLNSSNVCAPVTAASTKEPAAAVPKATPPQEENDALFRVILSALDAAGTSHTVLHHEPTRTSAEVRSTFSCRRACCQTLAVVPSQSAAVRGVTLDSGAKAMLVSLPSPAGAPAEYALLVLSASRQLDWKAIRKALGRKTQLASQEAVYELTGCVPGAVPPFGSLFCAVCPGAAVRTVLDPSLQEQGLTMNFNAGLRTASVGMAVADYIALEQPTLLRFSK